MHPKNGVKGLEAYMSGDQECYQIIHDALVRHVLPRLRVDPAEHRGQQVLPVAVVRVGRLPSVEHAPGRLTQHIDVGPVLLVLRVVEERRQREPPGPVAGLGEEVAHGLDEGVQGGRVVAVEAVAHGAEREGVEGEAREVVGDGDGRVRAVARPLEGELARDVVHLVEHVADGQGPEGGHEDAVGDAPVLLALARREEAVVDAIPDFVERGGNGLLEPLLVACLVH